ncbi:MAG TPA: efflux RND transporter permease subunit [Candidatus Bathyarchaeia archaeon]|nr:efflux RND transporter permease subunit [Candidatus Bathyarchaeia archaeon]
MRDKQNRRNRRNRGLLKNYAEFVAYRRVLLLALFLIFSLVVGYQASLMQTVGMSQEDMLPGDVEVIKTLALVSDQFAGAFSSSTIIVEIDPSYAKSNEIRDVRDPEVLRYVDALAERTKLIYGVIDARSAADVIKAVNGGKIPSSLRSVKSLSAQNELVEQQLSMYISDDYTLSVVRLTLLDDLDAEEVVAELREVIRVNPPPGVTVEISGGPVEDIVMQELAGETMQTTSMISLALIIIILILLFVSIKYGLIPLVTILLGTVWTYGVLYLIGFEVTAMTSGAMAMIMGIGIDFGIQVTKRFRYELRTYEREEAMVNTLQNVFYPMTITTIAAVTGFLCLSLGDLPMMGDMGKMLAMGVLCCMVAALSVVPAVLVLLERKKRHD